MIFCISAWMSVGAFVFWAVEQHNINSGRMTLWEWLVFDGASFLRMLPVWLLVVVVMIVIWPVPYHRIVWRVA